MAIVAFSKILNDFRMRAGKRAGGWAKTGGWANGRVGGRTGKQARGLAGKRAGEQKNGRKGIVGI